MFDYGPWYCYLVQVLANGPQAWLLSLALAGGYYFAARCGSRFLGGSRPRMLHEGINR